MTVREELTLVDLLARPSSGTVSKNGCKLLIHLEHLLIIPNLLVRLFVLVLGIAIALDIHTRHLESGGHTGPEGRINIAHLLVLVIDQAIRVVVRFLCVVGV